MSTKIVLVEDDPDLSSALVVLLKAEGYIVKTATTGEGGLKLMQDDVPAIAIIDLFTHSIHGIHLLERLRNIPTTKDICCIILTNIDHEGHKQKAKSLGASEYLIKAKTPLTEILKAVKSCTESKEV